MDLQISPLSSQMSVLAERPVPPLDEDARQRLRARVVSRLESVMNEASAPRFVRRRSRLGMVFGGLAAAAGVAFALGLVSQDDQPNLVSSGLGELRVSGPALCKTEAGAAPTDCSRTEAVSELLTMEAGHAELRTHRGVLVGVGEKSRLLLAELAGHASQHRIRIDSGEVSVQVPRQNKGHSFAVEAPDLTVLVHGTAFSVKVREDAGGVKRSCVVVTEGVVSVTQAGTEHWIPAPFSYGCESEPVAASAPRPVEETELLDVPASSSTVKRDQVGQGERSTLVVEARLLQLALSAERKGDLGLAERRLGALIAQYPNSVVLPEAKAALTRVQARSQKAP